MYIVSATKRGEDMSWETFKCAVDMADEYGEYITLGGGEPTLHPDFDRMLMYAIAHANVYIVTNGSQTDRALALAALAKRGVIGCALSQDVWHDPIDESVVKAFTKKPFIKYNEVDNDEREIRDIGRYFNGKTSGVFRQGRAARRIFVENNLTEIGCACENEPFVRPSGKVYQCGCKNSPCRGDVFNGFSSEDASIFGEWRCYRKINMQKAKELGLVKA
ncbi:MAG: hypothetical protein WC390_10315 [Sulfurimonas sp.]|jgi:hypothetical protein